MSKIELKQAMNGFGFELFKTFHLRHKNEFRNICFSPIAVFNSLTMILMGSEEESQKQLATVLQLKDINKSKEMLEELKNSTHHIIKANNDILLAIRYLYISKSVDLNSEYISILKNFFEVKAKKVDFESVENALNIINNDSKEHTDGVIDSVIELKDITGENANVKMILTNSLFFRGFWAANFDEVFKDKFHFGKDNSENADIHFMSRLGLYRYIYCKQLEAHVVCIPYVASDLRMIIILPDNTSSDGHHLIQYLNKDLFETIMNTLQSQDIKKAVDLIIPRFALNGQKISVQRTLKQLGAIDIFDESLANLKSMSEQKIYLTKLVHKAFILVDERGSEVSGNEVKRHLKKNKSFKPIVFKANHPFVFVIADKVTHVAALMAYIGDPQEMLEVVKESDLTPEQINKLLAKN